MLDELDKNIGCIAEKCCKRISFFKIATYKNNITFENCNIYGFFFAA
jgi:hypothetical protein